MNCIEFTLLDQNGEVHSGRITNTAVDKVPFTEERVAEISERMIEEGFKVLEMKLVMIQ